MVLANVLLSGITKAWLLYVGLVFIAMVVWVPGGVVSLVGRLCWRDVPRYAAWALAFAGFAAMVEMVYQLQLRAALGPQVHFLGLVLDATSSLSWLGAVVALVAGTLWGKRT